jgi:hypothetical protein
MPPIVAHVVDGLRPAGAPIENQSALQRNPRMAMPYRTLAAMPDTQLSAIKAEAQAFLAAQTPWR